MRNPYDILNRSGIVQGMSGSPVIQDGKLIGAVTHVLVNDPTRGYGILVENMLDAAGQNLDSGEYHYLFFVRCGTTIVIQVK